VRSPLADEKALDFYGIGLMSPYLWAGMTGQVNNSGIYLPRAGIATSSCFHDIAGKHTVRTRRRGRVKWDA